MAGRVSVRVPLPPGETLALLQRAALSLRHVVREVDLAAGRCELQVDFTLRSFATFRVRAAASDAGEGATQLTLAIRPTFKLTPWTGIGQSEQIGWELVGEMQRLLDPERYRRLGSGQQPPAASSQDRLLQPQRQHGERNGEQADQQVQDGGATPAPPQQLLHIDMRQQPGFERNEDGERQSEHRRAVAQDDDQRQ